MTLSHVTCKTDRNGNQGELGIQPLSLRPRQTELDARFDDPPQPLSEYQEWLLFLEQLAINPRGFPGKIPGVKRKPMNPIQDYAARILYICGVLGVDTSDVRAVDAVDEALAEAIIQADALAIYNQ